jgi:hypothetical protein
LESLHTPSIGFQYWPGFLQQFIAVGNTGAKEAPNDTSAVGVLNVLQPAMLVSTSAAHPHSTSSEKSKSDKTTQDVTTDQMTAAKMPAEMARLNVPQCATETTKSPALTLSRDWCLRLVREIGEYLPRDHPAYAFVPPGSEQRVSGDQDENKVQVAIAVPRDQKHFATDVRATYRYGQLEVRFIWLYTWRTARDTEPRL